MIRKSTLALNTLFLAGALWLFIVKAVIPFINAANAISVSVAMELLGMRPWIFLAPVVMFGIILAQLNRKKWSVVAYLSSWILLIFSVVLLASGIFSSINEGSFNISTLVVIVASALLLFTAFMNGRMLKSFKQIMTQS